MDNEIKKIIEKNLPAQVGETLQKRLREAEADRELVGEQIKALEDSDRIISQLSSSLAAYRQFDERNDKLTIRENAVGIKETQQKVDELNIRLEESNKRADIVVDFTKGLVRNTTFRKTVFDNENQAGYYGPNNEFIQPSPINKNSDETKTED